MFSFSESYFVRFESSWRLLRGAAAHMRTWWSNRKVWAALTSLSVESGRETQSVSAGLAVRQRPRTQDAALLAYFSGAAACLAELVGLLARLWGNMGECLLCVAVGTRWSRQASTTSAEIPTVTLFAGTQAEAQSAVAEDRILFSLKAGHRLPSAFFVRRHRISVKLRHHILLSALVSGELSWTLWMQTRPSGPKTVGGDESQWHQIKTALFSNEPHYASIKHVPP